MVIILYRIVEKSHSRLGAGSWFKHSQPLVIENVSRYAPTRKASNLKQASDKTSLENGSPTLRINRFDAMMLLLQKIPGELPLLKSCFKKVQNSHFMSRRTLKFFSTSIGQRLIWDSAAASHRQHQRKEGIRFETKYYVYIICDVDLMMELVQRQIYRPGSTCISGFERRQQKLDLEPRS